MNLELLAGEEAAQAEAVIRGGAKPGKVMLANGLHLCEGNVIHFSNRM